MTVQTTQSEAEIARLRADNWRMAQDIQWMNAKITEIAVQMDEMIVRSDELLVLVSTLKLIIKGQRDGIAN